MSDTDSVLYGIPIHEITQATGCSNATAFRYKSGGSIPEPVKRLLQLILHGDLGLIDKAFAGWTINAGMLITPNGDKFETGLIQAIPYKDTLIRHYQTEQRVPRQADFISDKFVVNEIASASNN